MIFTKQDITAISNYYKETGYESLTIDTDTIITINDVLQGLIGQDIKPNTTTQIKEVLNTFDGTILPTADDNQVTIICANSIIDYDFNTKQVINGICIDSGSLEEIISYYCLLAIDNMTIKPDPLLIQSLLSEPYIGITNFLRSDYILFKETFLFLHHALLAWLWCNQAIATDTQVLLMTISYDLYSIFKCYDRGDLTNIELLNALLGFIKLTIDDPMLIYNGSNNYE